MKPTAWFVALAAAAALVGTVHERQATPPRVPAPIPANEDLEAVFFDALTRRPERREAAIAAARRRVLEAPGDARASLLLGLGHLWVAAENPPPPAEAVEHLVLARHALRRARLLNPHDGRIPTWLQSVELALAHAEGRGEDALAALERLRQLAEKHPCFHSVAFAIAAWDGPADRPAFAEALRQLERAAACGADDPSVQNLPRWPHNVHGFLTALSDYQLKTGQAAKAETSLMVAQQWAGFDAWPHREQVESRLKNLGERAALFADADPANDPGFIFAPGGPVSCASCHQGTAGP